MAELPYAAVGDEPDAATHRVFTQALGSLAPNTLVVGVDATGACCSSTSSCPPTIRRPSAKPLPEP